MRELALLFLRLGATAFGGPAAHIAFMEEEVVRRRQWLSREEFLDLLGATNLIPGPNSTEMAIHIGYRRHGWRGLLVAGACFILPAAILVACIAWLYVRYARVPQAEGVLYGIKPVIIAIVADALWRLARTAMKTPLLATVAVAATAALFLGANELLVLFAAGALVMLARVGLRQSMLVALAATAAVGSSEFLGVPRSSSGCSTETAPEELRGTPRNCLGAMVPLAATSAAHTVGLLPLFLFFLKVGSVLFGSGYVLIAFLRADLVERWGWLTESQLLDAVAVGQITPGPVFTTATFIGWVLAGAPGAIVATIGIFLPAFFFVAISGPLVPKLRASRAAAAFLDGLNAASVALMLFVTWQLGRAAIVDLPTVALALVSAVVLWRFRVNSAWLVLGGAVTGWFITSIH